MSSRRLILLGVICIVAVVFWEMQRQRPPIEVPSAAPVVSPTPPAPPVVPLPKRTLPESPKKAVASKTNIARNPVAPAHHPLVAPPPLVTRPPVPVVPPAPEPAEPKEWTGNSDTAIKHAGQIVVQNDHQWVHFWSEHHPDEAAPEIDFLQNMVVGVFQGRRPADGFKVQIKGVRVLSDSVVVDYVELSPPPGTFQMGVEVYPYDIKVVPRSALHVKFNQLTAQYAVSPYQHPAPSTAPAPTPVSIPK